MILKTFDDLVMATYVGDTTWYLFFPNLHAALRKLRKYITQLRYLNGYIKNLFWTNVDKCNLLTNSKSHKEIQIGENSWISLNSVKLLSIHIARQLDFDDLTSQLCTKAIKIFYTFTRICKYLNQTKRKAFMKAFVMSHISYCPLTWMSHSKNMEHRIKKINKAALKLVCNDTPNRNFNKLLLKDKSVTFSI